MICKSCSLWWVTFLSSGFWRIKWEGVYKKSVLDTDIDSFFGYRVFYISAICQHTHHVITTVLALYFSFFFFFFQRKQVFTCMVSTTGIKEILWIMYFFISMAKELQIGHRKFVITFIGKDGLYQCSCCNLTKFVCFFIHTVRWWTGPVEPAALQLLLCVLLG